MNFEKEAVVLSNKEHSLGYFLVPLPEWVSQPFRQVEFSEDPHGLVWPVPDDKVPELRESMQTLADMDSHPDYEFMKDEDYNVAWNEQYRPLAQMVLEQLDSTSIPDSVA